MASSILSLAIISIIPGPIGQDEKQIINFQPLENRWALVIGISDYLDKDNNLQFADNDAKRFYNALTSLCRFKKEHVRLLLNKDATRESIRKSIESWLNKNTGIDDKLIIYFSGHGTQDVSRNKEELDGYDEFLVPYDFDSNDISTAIRDKEFAIWIRNLLSNNILLIFDSCYSGGAAKAKGFNFVKTKGQINVSSFAKKISLELPKEKGVALMAACQDNQLSYETEIFHSGLFTYYLLDSLNLACDTNQDNIISMKECFSCLGPEVNNFSITHYNKAQTPVLLNSLQGDFDLAYLPAVLGKKGQNDVIQASLVFEQALNSNNLDRRIQLLENACSLDSKSLAYRTSLAETYRSNKQYDKAIYNYEISLTISDFRNDDIFFEMSRCYEALDRYQESIEYINKAISKNINEYKYHNYLAYLNFKNKNVTESRKEYLRSIKINPVQNIAYFEMARLEIVEKKYVEAFGFLDQAIINNPDHAENYYLKRLLTLFINKDKDGAEAIKKTICRLGEGLWEFKNLYCGGSTTIETMGELFDKEYENDIRTLDYIAEKYVAVIASYSNKNDAKNVKYYYDKLIYLYPFLDGNVQFSKYLKSRN